MKKIKKVIKIIEDYIEFIFRKFRKVNCHNSPQILIQIQNPNLYHRFFYIFLKNFQRAEYSIYYPMSFSKYRNLKHSDNYINLVVNETSLISLKNRKNPNYIIKDEDISLDFFKDYFENDNHETGYHFPLGFHPLMYHLNLDEVQYDFPKMNSIFCFGNFDENAYSEIKKTPFTLMSRVEVLELCKQLSNYLKVSSQEEMDEILSNKPSKKICIAEKENYQISIENIREYLSQFQFYLACPGVVMPHCHNIIEAMSVGCIPILEQQYADLFYPELKHEINAIIFQNQEDLKSLLEKKLWQITPEKINSIRERVNIYYQNHLTPKIVVYKVIENLHSKPIYVNAEHRSVRRLKNSYI